MYVCIKCNGGGGGGAGGVATLRGELQLDMYHISCFLALYRGGKHWRQERGGGLGGRGK